MAARLPKPPPCSRRRLWPHASTCLNTPMATWRGPRCPCSLALQIILSLPVSLPVAASCAHHPAWPARCARPPASALPASVLAGALRPGTPLIHLLCRCCETPASFPVLPSVKAHACESLTDKAGGCRAGPPDQSNTDVGSSCTWLGYERLLQARMAGAVWYRWGKQAAREARPRAAPRKSSERGSTQREEEAAMGSRARGS